MRIARRQMVVAVAAFAFGGAVLVAVEQTSGEARDHSRESAKMAADLGYGLDYDEPPKAERITKPMYPRRAFEACVEGTVIVLIGINPDSSVRANKVDEYQDGLDEAAQACETNWDFRPARRA